MNKKKILPAAFVLLLLASIGLASAQSQIGVSPGDRFTYSVTSNTTAPLIYQVLNDPKDVQTLTVTILSKLSPNMVSLNMTQQFKNGTLSSWLENKDLTSATSFPMTFANLNVKDSLWSSEPLSPKVNDTVTQSLSSGSRQINHAYVGYSETGYDSVNFSFDRQTGMPTEIRYVESSDVSTTLTLISTSLWTIPEFPSGIILVSLMLFVSIGVAITVYKRRNVH